MNPILFLFVLILSFVDILFDLYKLVLFVYIITTLLFQFEILNPHKPFFRHFTPRSVYNFCAKLIEPALRKIRKHVPLFGGIDLSPIVLFLAISFVQYTFFYLIGKILGFLGANPYSAMQYIY